MAADFQMVYLVMAHHRPDLLSRLVETLTEDGLVYLHLDKKFNLGEFQDAVLANRNVRLVQPRISVKWGGYSVVRATLCGLRQIREETDGSLYVSLLSGQDFPIKPTEQIRQHLRNRFGSEFIDYRPLGNPGMFRVRIEGWHVHDLLRIQGVKRVNQWINTLVPTRRFIPGLIPYVGIQWFTITREAIDEIFDFLEKTPHFERFFRLVDIPDELFFQTLLLNSRLRDKVTSDHLRMLHWTSAGTPRVWEESDIDLLIGSPGLFARKFESADVLDSLRQRLRSPSASRIDLE